MTENYRDFFPVSNLSKLGNDIILNDTSQICRTLKGHDVPTRAVKETAILLICSMKDVSMFVTQSRCNY